MTLYFFILGAFVALYLLIKEVFKFVKTKKLNIKFALSFILFISIYIYLLVQWYPMLSGICGRSLR
jgi:hypothetical protein